MKALLLLITLTFSLAALANDPGIFTGRYKTLNGKNCEYAAHKNAYIKVSTLDGKIPALDINVYGREAIFMSVPAGNGKILSPGSRDFTDTISVKWPTENIMKVRIVTKSNNYRDMIFSVTEHNVALNGNLLTITTATDGHENERCELIRN